jgi:hypothetical protein
MVTVTVKLSSDLAAKVAAEARRKRVSKSAIIRDSLEGRFRGKRKNARPTVGELTGHLIGKAEGGPTDLSTNKKHMAGFGE